MHFSDGDLLQVTGRYYLAYKLTPKRFPAHMYVDVKLKR